MDENPPQKNSPAKKSLSRFFSKADVKKNWPWQSLNFSFFVVVFANTKEMLNL